MNLVLTEMTCKICKTRLTEYEVEHKESLCMDCYEEKHNDKGKQ
ncbi:hypothetical protein [Brevibacillus massiliensis]|jgi:hypothetical protein|nr:hypothetical protein [Brevibacillus massiliensis]